MQFEELLAQAAVFAGPPGVLVLQLEVEARGQGFDRFGEVQALRLHDEGDDVAGVSAAEALVEPLVGRNVEGGRLFVGEGAEALVL